MRRFLYLLSFLGVLLASVQAGRASDYYRYPGVGGYGVSDRKIQCPNCGRTISASSSHMCRKAGSSSSSGSYSHSSSSSTAEDRAAAAAIDGDPTLLVNQTSFAPFEYKEEAGTDEGGSPDRDGSYASGSNGEGGLPAFGVFKKKKKKYIGPILVVLVLAGGIGLAYRMFRKKKGGNIGGPAGASASPFVARPNAGGETLKAGIAAFSEKVRAAGEKAGEMMEKARGSEQAKNAAQKLGKLRNSAQEAVRGVAAKIAEKGNGTRAMDELSRLHELYKSGAISEAEYNRLKEKILKKF